MTTHFCLKSGSYKIIYLGQIINCMCTISELRVSNRDQQKSNGSSIDVDLEHRDFPGKFFPQTSATNFKIRHCYCKKQFDFHPYRKINLISATIIILILRSSLDPDSGRKLRNYISYWRIFNLIFWLWKWKMFLQ